MKAKLGIHIGFLACIIFLAVWVGGMVPAVLLAGYVMICEDNDFLRMSALKALLIVLFVAVLNFLIGAIPDILFELIDRLTRIFGAETYFGNLKAISKIEQIFNFFIWIVNTCKTLLLLLLAFLAVRIKTIPLPLIDKLIDKFVGSKQLQQ